MVRTVLALGLVGSACLMSIAVCAEESAPQPPSAQPASQCSGLGCLFGQSFERPPPAAAPKPPSPTEAAAPAASVPSEPVAAAGQQPNAAPTLKRDKPRRAKLKPRPPVYTVTIAVDAAEVGRMRHLAEIMPKPPARLVGVRDGADLSVVARLDKPDGGATRLFVEQLHIVAGDKIKSAADLAGKTVSFGPEGSASQAAGRKAFAAIGVDVKETPLDIDNALDGVGSGDIAAATLLAPQPDARLERLSGLHLVAWPDAGKLPAGAVATSIDGSAYPKLASSGAKIPAVGVDALLVVNARGAHEPATRKFMAALSQHAASLARHGFERLATDGRAQPRFASRERR